VVWRKSISYRRFPTLAEKPAAISIADQNDQTLPHSAGRGGQCRCCATHGRTLLHLAGGAIHLLVCSAGASHPGYFEELPPEVFVRQMEVNYLSAVFAAQVRGLENGWELHSTPHDWIVVGRWQGRISL
jgi:NAD(P)-dependent dehydrogenase (short-subunit alcohol dehydrogenase family)